MPDASELISKADYCRNSESILQAHPIIPSLYTMKVITSFVAVLLAASPALAHYRWDKLNDNALWQYIRESTNDNSPVTDLASNDLRCNVGTSGTGVNTTAVKAGDSFTFALDIAVYHQGPVTAYLSKAPSTASAYVGDGDWFKIAEEGPTFSGSSATWPLRDSYTYKLPTCIADGDYLLRVEQLAIHNPGGTPQVSPYLPLILPSE